jgi:gluconolactonase
MSRRATFRIALRSAAECLGFALCPLLGACAREQPAALGGAQLTAAWDAPLPPANSFCPRGPYAAAPASGTLVVQTLCTNLAFTEGPVWVAGESSLFFSDFDNGSAKTNYNGVIVKYTAGSGCSTWLEDTGSNGLALSTDGNLIACIHANQSVTGFDLETQAPEVLADNYRGDPFSSPNDLALRADGNLYFSDPAWNLGERTQKLPQALYRVDPLGELSQVEVLDNRRPNGVAVSPDGTRLYVALNTEIRQYDLDATGQASNPRLFASAGSDGLAVDCAGNVYVTSGGIRVFTRERTELANLQVGGSITNLAFGGPSGTTLFITGGTQLRAVELSIPGLPY